MLDFRQGRRPRNYLARREQWRLLALVLMLGLVAVLAMEARKAEHYAWLWRAGHRALTDGAGGDAHEAEPIDTRMTPRTDEGSGPRTLASPAAAAGSSVSTRRADFRGVQPDSFSAVQDDSPFLHGERDAWFHLLDILRQHDDQTLASECTGRATFVQLFRQSDHYRGRLVGIRGTLRRAHRLSAPKNELGVQDYYQTWVTPEDDPSNLIVVYCLDLPEGFPTGMTLSEDVEVVGFFFKRWLYRAKDTLRSAPVLLARTVRWHRQPAAAPSPDESPWTVAILFAVAVVFAGLAVLYITSRTGRENSYVLRKPAGPGVLPDFEIPAELSESPPQSPRGEQTGEP